MTCVEICLPYLDEYLKDLALLVFLFCYLLFHCIVSIFVWCECFCLNLVIVVDYYDLIFHSIFLENPY